MVAVPAATAVTLPLLTFATALLEVDHVTVRPDGTVLAEAGKDEAIIWADFDPEQVRRTRAQIPVFTDRMPELY